MTIWSTVYIGWQIVHVQADFCHPFEVSLKVFGLLFTDQQTILPPTQILFVILERKKIVAIYSSFCLKIV